MVEKKKTVKELTVEVEELRKIVKELQNVIKGIKTIENVDIRMLAKKLETVDSKEKIMKKVENLEKKSIETIKMVESVSNDLKGLKENMKESLDNEKEPQMFKCKECENVFEQKRELTKHIKKKHVKSKKCLECEELFNENWLLEKHMKTHDEIETFNCEVCDKNFFLEWRLKKHLMGHKIPKVVKCHYFNNGESCPFEEVGCKFDHSRSKLCRDLDSCSRVMCQFRHESTEKESVETEDIEKSKPENETSDDDEVYPCLSCEIVFDDLDDLIDHYGETGHNIEY